MLFTMKKENRLTKRIGRLAPYSFGSWALGGEYWGEQDHKDSVRAIHRALTLGVSHFDTAPVYGKGRSEQLLGQQLRKIRNDISLGTKVFYSDPDKMVESFHTSLKRLMTDYIDIFYIHWPLSDCDMRPGMEALEKLRKEGRIRAIGVSNFTIPQIEMLEEAGEVDVFQGGYNIFWPKLEEKLIPWLKENNIGFIPYGVLAQGILTDNGIDHLAREHDGFRHKMILYSPEIREKLTSLLTRIGDECSKWKISVEQAVSAFTLMHVSADTVLLGVRNRNQADSNFRHSVEELPRSLSSLLEQLLIETQSFIPDVPNLFNHKS
ncbi:aldo/keto reductase [Oceanispirochaeta sp. M1]|nr:aldo/keto reductase [Oceanispirochaeta sp. M1]